MTTETPARRRGKKDGARPNREGKPWRRADGRWTCRVYGPETGSKARYVYGKTRAEAVTSRDKLAAELADGMPGGKGRTVAEFFEHWTTVTLPQQVKTREIDGSTLDSYRDNARLHILPHLGHLLLRDLTVPRVRQWQDDLLTKPTARTRPKVRTPKPRTASTPGPKPRPRPAPAVREAKPLSPRTVVICHGILHRALADAVREEVWGLKRNPVDLVKAPKYERTPPVVLTKDEASALLEASIGTRMWCYWLVALALGLRRGEGLGLRWSDIDFEAKTIRLSVQIQRRRGEPGPDGKRAKGKLVAKQLKTTASKATLPVPASVIEALLACQKEQRRERMQARVWHDSADLVFTTTIGTAIDPRKVNAEWAKVCDAAGTRRVRVHDLRHACATYLQAAGIDLRTVQGTLRHTRMATTEIYLHMLDEIQRDAADVMDGILADLRAPRRKKAAGS